MRVVTKKTEFPPTLWEFLRDRLPSGLICYSREDGYGSEYGVTVRTRGSAGVLNRWFGDRVATVEERRVELLDPSWASDFEDLIRRFESERPDQEVTLVVCES